MRTQLDLSFPDSAERPGSASPVPFPSSSPFPAHDAYAHKFSHNELVRKLGRLIDQLDHPRPRLKRRRRLLHISEILE